MELTEHYQPEFVRRFMARDSVCECQACRNAPQGWPYISIKMKNQQRESLDMACETAAREIVLNPEAFVLHTSQAPAQGEEVLSGWSEVLNQQCINLAIHPALSHDERLYAIGILLSKAQQYRDNGENDPALLASMGDQLASLADQGILSQQFTMLPEIPENPCAVLKEMGAIRLTLNLPMAEKMVISLKLSELGIMSPSRLAERLDALKSHWQTIPLFDEQPWLLNNILLYALYSRIFPGLHCDNYGEAFLNLARTFFRLKAICSIRCDERQELSPEDVAMLASALEAWQSKNPSPSPAQYTADYRLLHGLSLLR